MVCRASWSRLNHANECFIQKPAITIVQHRRAVLCKVFGEKLSIEQSVEIAHIHKSNTISSEKKSHKCKKDSCLHCNWRKKVRKMNKRIANVCMCLCVRVSHVLLVFYSHLRAYLHAITNPLNLLLTIIYKTMSEIPLQIVKSNQ